jgi:hypothetical protein
VKRVRPWPGRLRAFDIQIYNHWLLAAPDDYGFHRLIYRRIHFLMRNPRRHVDEIPRAGFLDVFQAVAPTEAGTAADDVEDRLHLSMMMGAGACRGLYHYCSRPQFARSGAGVSDGRCPGHAGSLGSVRVQLARADDADAVVFPVGHKSYYSTQNANPAFTGGAGPVKFADSFDFSSVPAQPSL